MVFFITFNLYKTTMEKNYEVRIFIGKITRHNGKYIVFDTYDGMKIKKPVICLSAAVHVVP